MATWHAVDIAVAFFNINDVVVLLLQRSYNQTLTNVIVHIKIQSSLQVLQIPTTNLKITIDKCLQ